MATKNLNIRIGANADQARKELKSFNKGIDNINKNLGNIASTATKSFIALGGAIGVSVKQFAAFEKDFTNVVTLLDKSSFATKSFEDGVNDLKKGVLDLRTASGESFENLNKGLFDLVSAGVPAEKAISSLKVATDLAAAGATETSVAVDGITSALNAYSLSADEAQSVAEKFFTAQKGGKTTVEELARGFGQVGATAEAFGVSLDELFASVSAVTLGGVKTSQAYTGLNAVLSNIAKPTADAQKEAKRLGIQFDSTALRTKGLKGFLDDLRNANGFTQKSVERLFGSVEAQKIAFSLTGSQADTFTSQLQALSDETQSAATFQDALAKANATTQKSIDRIKGAFESIIVQIGERFAPLLNTLADFISDLSMRFNNLSDGTKNIISGFLKWGTILSGLTAGIALFGIGVLKVVKGFALLNNALKFSKVAALAYQGVLTGITAFQKVFNATLKAGRLYATAFWGAATLGIGILISYLPEIINWFKKWNDRLNIIGGVWNALKMSFLNGFDRIKLGILEIRQFFIKVQSAIVSGISSILGVASKLPFVGDSAKKASKGFEIMAQESRDAAKQIENDQNRIRKAIGARDVSAKTGMKLVEGGGGESEEVQDEGDKGVDAEIEKMRELNIQRQELRAEDLENKKEHEKAKKDVEDNFIEARAEREAQLTEENRERLAELNAEDQERLLEQLQTKDEIENEYKKKRIQSEIDTLKKSQQVENAFGLRSLALDQFLAQQKLGIASNLASNLLGTLASQNETAFKMQKGLNIAQAIMDTYAGANAALRTLPPPASFVTAALTVATGLLNVSRIQSQSFTPAASGGVLQGGTAGKDSIPIMGMPNEIMMPSNIGRPFMQEFPDFRESILRATDLANNTTEQNVGGQNVDVTIGFTPDASQYITAKQFRGQQLGIDRSA